MRTEIEAPSEVKELQLSEIEIQNIEAPEVEKAFEDPFKLDPNAEEEEDQKAKKDKGKGEEEEEVEDDGPKYLLGPFKQDSEGGDAS